jgi:1-acyl-sn-glycerol-3-phosphate acyltransferase
MLRTLLWHFARFLFWLLSDTKAYGLENIPPTGGYILCSNHLGLFDAPLVFAVIERKDVSAIIAKKHHKNLIKRTAVNAVNGIWINRDEPDTQAIRQVRDYLKEGSLLGIAPEGTRSKTGAMQNAKTGVAFIADKAGVGIIPMAITGTHRDLTRLLKLQRLHIRITFGKPFTLPPIERSRRDECLQENTDLIMYTIASMLPPEYRGVYADFETKLKASQPNTSEISELQVPAS